MTLANRLWGDTAWVGLDAALSRGALLLAMILVARMLGATEFGALAIVQGTVTLLASLAGAPLRLTASSEVAASRGDPVQRLRTLRALLWGGLGGALVFALLAAVSASHLARHVLGNPDLADALRIGSLLLPLEVMLAVLLGILGGLGQQRRLAATGAVSGMAVSIALIAGAATAGLQGALWGLVLGSAAAVAARAWGVAASLRGTDRRLPVGSPGTDWSVLGRVGAPALAVTLLWTPANWLGSVLLVNSPDGYSQMGVLAAANQWFALMLFVPNALGFASLPLLSAARGADAEMAFEQTRRDALRSSGLVALVAAVLVAAASPLIMKSYGTQFASGWPVLALLAASVVPAALSTVLANELTAKGRIRRVVVAQLWWTVAYLGSALLLLEAGGGAAALAAAMLVGNLARLVSSARETGVSLRRLRS